MLRPEDEDNRTHTLFMVTNKHVLWNRESVVIRLKKHDSNELVILDVPLLRGDGLAYSVHPNEKVDIAAILLNASVVEKNNLQFYGYTMETNFNGFK